MPSIDDIFPDKWLKAHHLILADGRRPIIPATIRGAGVEELHNPRTNQKERRLIVEFDGKDKRLILNKTQAEAVADIAGSRDYTKWRGVRVAVQAGIAPNKKETILILTPAPIQTPTPTPAQGDPDPNPAQTPAPTQEDANPFN